MSKADFDIEGLITLSKRIDSAVSTGLLHAGGQIKELASALAPVDEGLLAASGEYNLITPNTVEISFGNNLPDARAVGQEYGTVFMPAQPYLGPAVRAIDIGLEVAKAIKKL